MVGGLTNPHIAEPLFISRERASVICLNFFSAAQLSVRSWPERRGVMRQEPTGSAR